jgi:hypothetical protein
VFPASLSSLVFPGKRLLQAQKPLSHAVCASSSHDAAGSQSLDYGLIDRIVTSRDLSRVRTGFGAHNGNGG